MSRVGGVSQPRASTNTRRECRGRSRASIPASLTMLSIQVPVSIAGKIWLQVRSISTRAKCVRFRLEQCHTAIPLLEWTLIPDQSLMLRRGGGTARRATTPRELRTHSSLHMRRCRGKTSTRPISAMSTDTMLTFSLAIAA